jgi:L-rhamnose mutarotase
MKTAMIIRKAFVIRAKAGMLETYIKRHNPIWPQLATTLKAHGVHNYSIFHRPASNELFGYLEITDEALFARLAEQPVCQAWWLYMTEVLECESPVSQKGKEEQLVKIFHLT